MSLAKINFREAETQDWVQAVPFLVEAITLAPAQTIADVHIEQTLAHFMAAAERGGAFIVDERYLVVYDLYNLWYAPSAKTVEEKLILCIYPDNPGTMFSPIKFLLGEKQFHEAKHLVIGDFLHQNQEKYGRVLQKLGFSKVNTVYAA